MLGLSDSARKNTSIYVDFTWSEITSMKMMSVNKFEIEILGEWINTHEIVRTVSKKPDTASRCPLSVSRRLLAVSRFLDTAIMRDYWARFQLYEYDFFRLIGDAVKMDASFLCTTIFKNSWLNSK